jgi:hypothetical protein
MEINKMVKELIDSGIIENQELALTILGSDKVNDQERRVAIDKFIKDYQEGKVTMDNAEQEHLFNSWLEIYRKTVKLDIKNRVTRISYVR